MTAEPQPTRRPRREKQITAEQARELIIKKLRAAAAKGATSLFSTKTPLPKRAALEEALAALESEHVVVADRSRARPKYYLRELAPPLPSLETVCARLEGIATGHHPQLLSISELKRALSKAEKSLFAIACDWLETQQQLIKLHRGKTTMFASARALRSVLDVPIQEAPPLPQGPAEPDELHPESIREAYRAIASGTGFPAVEIAALQRATGAPRATLQQWLIDEYQQGRAVFSFGDWSLAEEGTRAAAVELGEARYLLVRLQE